MLTTLDKYIIRKFLGTFFFTITLLLLVTVIFDISEKIDDFLKHSVSLSEIVFDYYVNFLVYFGNLFSSLIIFISVIIFTSKMASNTEIVAILNSGVSFKRMLRPYMISATILAGISLLLSNWVIPTTNQTRLDFTYKYIFNPPSTRLKNLHRQIRPNMYIYFENFNSSRNVGYQFSMETFKDNQLVSKFEADYMRWNPEDSLWSAENFIQRNISADNKESLSYGKLKDTVLAFVPSELGTQTYLVETMNFNELNDFIAKEKLRGAENINFFEIEKHQRFSYPFSAYILTLIGASLASKRKRGGMGLNIALGLAFAVSYILFMKISITFATNGNLSPMLAVWIPNIVYSLLSLFLYRKVQK